MNLRCWAGHFTGHPQVCHYGMIQFLSKSTVKLPADLRGCWIYPVEVKTTSKCGDRESNAFVGGFCL